MTVTNVNEAPTDIALSKSSVLENAKIGTTVGVLQAIDPDGTSLKYSLISGAGSTDNDLFVLSGATLKTKAVFDFELKRTYSIRVRVTDAGGLTYEKLLTISVTDVAGK